MAVLHRFILCFSLILLTIVGMLNSVRQQESPAIIAFICCRPNYSGDVYTIWSNSKSLDLLLEDSQIKESLGWSSDGKWLTFSTLPTEYNPRIFSIRADGTEFYQSHMSGFHPTGSPDSTMMAVVYRESYSQQQSIVWANPRQAGIIHTVLVFAEKIYGLHWLNAQSLLFLVDYQDNTSKAYQLSLEDLSITPLNDVLLYFASNHPQWSPDGEWIVFEVVLDEYNIQIAKIRPDGSSYQVLTSGIGRNEYPAWSSDGKWIAFTSDRETLGQFKLYKIRSDGSDVQKLSNLTTVSYPTWSPKFDMTWHRNELAGLALGLIAGIGMVRLTVGR
jgi:Tol biopolymer transport system component